MSSKEMHSNKTLLRVIIAGVAVLLLCGVFCGAAAAIGDLQKMINNAPDGSTVTLDKSYTESITISKNLTLDLNGYKLESDEDSKSTIYVNGGAKVTITATGGGTITGGNSGIYISGKNTVVTFQSGTITDIQCYHHGCVFVKDGTFIMTGGTIKESNGRGVKMNDSTFIMNGGTISGNTWGGVQVSGIIAQFTMNGGTISGNTTDYGGGVYVWSGTFTMNDGSISGNRASKNGGGVYIRDDTFTMLGGTIDNNKAYDDGGGIYYSEDAENLITIKNAKITNNHAGNNSNVSDEGGGIYVEEKDGRIIEISNTEISNNTAEGHGGGIFIAKGTTLRLHNTAIIYNKTEASYYYEGGGIYVNSLSKSEPVRIYISGDTYVKDNKRSKQSKEDNIYFNGKLEGASGIYLTSNLTGEVHLHSNDVESGATFGKVEGSAEGADHLVSDDGNYIGTNKNGDLVWMGSYPPPITYGVHYYYTGPLPTGVPALPEDTNRYHRSDKATVAEAPVLPGYTFSGWTTTDAQISGGKVTIDDKPVFLKGSWKCTVTFDTNGHGTAPPQQLIPVIGGIAAEPKAPTDSGWTFEGWYTEKACENKWDFNTPVTGNITLYAKWIKGLVCYNGVAYSENTIIGGKDSPFTTDNAELKGSTLSLKADVSLEHALEVTAPENRNFTIDLHGHTLSLGTTNSSTPVLRIKDNGCLTVTDTSSVSLTDSSSDSPVNGGQISGGTYSGVIIENGSTFTLKGGTITNNRTVWAGGGVCTKGLFIMSGGNITENSATDTGGGVYVNEDGGTFTMNGGSISKNHAELQGGGVYVLGGGSFTMNDGSIAENETKGNGGGVYVLSGGSFTMNGGSISKNQAKLHGGGVYIDTSGMFKVSGAPDIRDNTKGTAADTDNVYLPAKTVVTITGDGLKDDAHLGITTYDLPTADKPVNITNRYPANFSECFHSDNPAYEIMPKESSGMYIVQLVPRVDFVKYGGVIYSKDTIIGGEGSPFTADNAMMNGTKLTLKKNVSLEYALEVTAPENRNFTIDLNGHTLSLGSTTATLSVITVKSGGCLTVTDGNTSSLNGGCISGGTGSGVVIENTGSFTLVNGSISNNRSGWAGGGVMNQGTFNMQNGRITGNTAKDGGGGGVYNDGTFTFSGGTIENNTAKNGGGVYVNSGTFTMSNGAVSANEAQTGSGGGVYVNEGSKFEFSGGEIDGNKVLLSEMCGGGVYVISGGSVVMSGGTVTNNNAGYGGGICVVNDGVLTQSGGKIGIINAGNTAIYGGGVYVECGIFTMSGGTISGNRATAGGGGLAVTSYSSASAEFEMKGGLINDNIAPSGSGAAVAGPADKPDAVEFKMYGNATIGPVDSLYLRDSRINVPSAFTSDTAGALNIMLYPSDPDGVIVASAPTYDDAKAASNHFKLNLSSYSLAVEDKDIVAVRDWYTVKFDSNGGSEVSDQPVKSGALVQRPSDPTKGSYSFNGWYTDNETFQNLYDFSTPVHSDFTLYAKWGINQWTVTYSGGDGASGTPPKDENKYASGDSVTVKGPGDLEKSGYYFNGWKAAGDSKIYKEGSLYKIGSNNVAFTADWKEIKQEYNLRYDGNEETSGTAPPAALHPGGSLVTVSDNVGGLQKTGYHFKTNDADNIVWNTAADGTGTWYEKGSTLIMPDRDYVLYAWWVPNTYTVTYHNNPSPASVKTQDRKYNDGLSLLGKETFAKAGYVLSKWTTKPDGSGESYEPGQTVGFTTGDRDNVDLYAQWTPISYTIQFEGNGGTGSMDTMSCIYDREDTLLPNQFIKAGSTFSGWIAPGSFALLPDCAKVKNLTTIDGDTVTLTAVWDAVLYDVTFYQDTGEVYETMKVPAGSPINKPADPDKPGRSFIGWYTTQTSGGEKWLFAGEAGAKPMPASPLSLYARWTSQQTCTVTYDGNHQDTGFAPTDSNKYPVGSSVRVMDNTGNLQKAGYTFSGWNDKADGTGRPYSVGSTFTITDNITLYARWTESPSPGPVPPHKSSDQGSSYWATETPTPTPTPTPTATPTPVETPSVKPIATETPKPASPAPLMGILAGLGAAAVLALRRR